MFKTAGATLAALLAAVCGAAGAQHTVSTASTMTAAETALPTAAQLPGFSRQVTSGPNWKGIWSRRQSDGMRLRLTIYTTATAAEAQELAKRMTMTQSGPMPHGSSSGRRIGQEVWRSAYVGGGPPRGAFTLIARDGDSCVEVQMMLPITEMKAGAPVQPAFRTADLRLAEGLVSRCLDRLARLGYTSRSTATQRAGRR